LMSKMDYALGAQQEQFFKVFWPRRSRCSPFLAYCAACVW